MSLYQASFRIPHECPHRELSERYPDLTIREWYLSDCQVLEISTVDAPINELLDDIEHLGTVLHENEDESGLHVVMHSCLCAIEGSIIERFEEYNCLYQPRPSTATGGNITVSSPSTRTISVPSTTI